MQVKYILAAAELALMTVFLIALPFVNLGNLAGVGSSLMLMFVTLRPDLVKRIWASVPGKVILGSIGVITAALLCFGAYCSVRMLSAMNSDEGKPSAVIVLGCQVIGERPSKMLARRLNTAIEYLDQEPDIPVIVSGGKGADEAISEALCMKNYLVANGIDEGRIIMEDKSTSTDENLEFSFAILDEMGLSRDIMLVTDGYHQCRAQMIAKKHGAGSISSRAASTEFRFIPTYWVREWFGIFQQMFLK